MTAAQMQVQAYGCSTAMLFGPSESLVIADDARGSRRARRGPPQRGRARRRFGRAARHARPSSSWTRSQPRSSASSRSFPSRGGAYASAALSRLRRRRARSRPRRGVRVRERVRARAPAARRPRSGRAARRGSTTQARSCSARRRSPRRTTSSACRTRCRQAATPVCLGRHGADVRQDELDRTEPRRALGELSRRHHGARRHEGFPAHAAAIRGSGAVTATRGRGALSARGACCRPLGAAGCSPRARAVAIPPARDDQASAEAVIRWPREDRTLSREARTEALVEGLCGDLSNVRSPRGSELNARSWQTEAPLRMLLNNLDPEVAEHPERLVVYGGSGRAARSHEPSGHRASAARARRRRDAARPERQAGRRLPHPSGGAPRVLIANALLVPRWATLGGVPSARGARA